MKTELIDQLLERAKKVAPEIEAALAEVKDAQLRGAMAAAIMQRVLADVPSDTTRYVSQAIKAPMSAPAPLAEKVKSGGTQGRILDLKSEGFFAEPHHLDQVLEELQVRGYHHTKSDVRMSLLRLTRRKMLRRIVYGDGRQKTFYYVNL
ncbi:MAG: hypothetical protein ACREQW_09205 [Candidatus Binatia bacterium]